MRGKINAVRFFWGEGGGGGGRDFGWFVSKTVEILQLVYLF